MKKRTTTYLLLTITIFVGLLIPILVQKGMFLDGITYAAISKNLALGYGQFWNPHYTKILYPSFSEHPPLVFIIESLFFKLFGDHFYTEKIYTFVTALFTALGIILSWRIVAKNNEIKGNFWFPVLLWLLVPIVTWSYKNNMLENTMGVFTIFSVYFILKALIKNNVYLIPISGILIVCAFLSKGFVGLFPIVTPLIFGIVFKQNRKSFLHFLLLIVSILIFSYIAYNLFPEIKVNVTEYLNQQLIPSLKGQREITTFNRFNIIFDLILDLAIILVLALLFLLVRTKNISDNKFKLNKNFLFFLIIGICASIPLIISLKQRKFYLVPSIPFYALSFGYLLHDFVMEKMAKLSETFFMWFRRILICVLGFILIISFLKFGDYSRDTDKIKDINLISKSLKEGTIISCTKDIWSDWVLVAYFSRISYISLDCDNDRDYYLIKNGEKFPNNYSKVEQKGNKYTLLKRSADTYRK